jgi:LysR family transcriptional regulator, hca operon transcriptional activator
VELTEAGKVFLDHARLALAQVNAGREAARRAAKRLKPALAVGFLSGQEVTWLAEATRLLGPDLRDIEMVVSSEHSSDLAQSLSMGRLDAALMRAEPDRQDLEYIPVAREPFVVVMRSGHRLTAFESVDDRELVGESFISGSNIAGVMQGD